MAYDNARTPFKYMPFASTKIAGEAIFSGCLSTLEVGRDAIASRLPPGLALPPGNSATCPCLLAFGEQAEGTTFFAGFPVPWGIQYHELMVAVPFVRLRGIAGGHLYVSGMACDFWPAVWNGNFYYGFEKRFARMGWRGDHFSVSEDGPLTGFDAAVHSQREVSTSALDRIRAAAALPVLGYRRDGVFVTSFFDWDFRAASVEAASLEFTGGQHLRELPMPTHARRDETFRIRGMHWRLGWPTPSVNRTIR